MAAPIVAPTAGPTSPATARNTAVPSRLSNRGRSCFNQRNAVAVVTARAKFAISVDAVKAIVRLSATGTVSMWPANDARHSVHHRLVGERISAVVSTAYGGKSMADPASGKRTTAPN